MEEIPDGWNSKYKGATAQRGVHKGDMRKIFTREERIVIEKVYNLVSSLLYISQELRRCQVLYLVERTEFYISYGQGRSQA